MQVHKMRTDTSVMLYITETYLDSESGVYSSKVIEELGTLESLGKALGLEGEEAITEWANRRAEDMARDAAPSHEAPLPPEGAHIIARGVRTSYNVGHLFLMDVVNRLGLCRFCQEITGDEVLGQTMYTLVAERVLAEGMGYTPEKNSCDFIGAHHLQMDTLAQCLTLMWENSEKIQDKAWVESRKLVTRDLSTVYLDRTDYLLTDLDSPDENGQTRIIVDVGLAEDASYMPMAFESGWGRRADTLTPLKERLAANYKLRNARIYEDVALPGPSRDQFFYVRGPELARWAPGVSVSVGLTAYLLTGFIGLLACRIVHRMVAGDYSLTDVISKLREMRMEHVEGEVWRPLYVRDTLSDSLHEAFGFRTDYEFIPEDQFDAIIAYVSRDGADR